MSDTMTAREAIQTLAEMPFGPEKLELALRAVRLADEQGDEDLAYLARMHLTAAAHWEDDIEQMIPSYGWCVTKHDEDPARFPIDPGMDGGADLLFQGKWMASCLAENSGFPLERITGVVDDLERRFREAGVSMHGLLQVRRDLALESGDLDLAQRLTTERDLHEVDDHSHCDACVRASDVDLALAVGDDARALDLWQQIHEGGYSCGEEPENVDVRILPALLRAGRTDEALATHASSYRLMRQFHPDALMFARHLEFLAVTGNLTRGLDMLERHIHALGAFPFAERNTMEALLQAAVLLDALVDAGRADVPVRGTQDAGLARLLGTDGPLTVGAFREAAWRTAEQLAERLDARDVSDGSARRVAAARALRDVRYDLPYSAPAFTPVARAEEDPTDAREWILAARRRAALGDEAGAAEARRRGLAFADPRVTPRALGDAMNAALTRGDDETAAALFRQRIASLREVGWDDKADAEERIGLILEPGEEATARVLREFEREDADPNARAAAALSLIALGGEEDPAEEGARRLALAEAGLEALPGDDPHLFFVGLAEHRVGGLISAGRADDAAVFALEALRDPRAAGLPTGELRRLAAIALAYADRREEAVALLDDVLGEFASAEGRSDFVADVARTSGLMLGELGRHAEAVSRLEFAAQATQRADQPDPSIAWQLGLARQAAGYTRAALESFEQIYQEEAEAGVDPREVFPTLMKLGEVARQADEPGLAYRAWSEALEVAEQLDEPGAIRGAAFALAELMRDFGDPDAVASFERALAASRRLETDGPLAELDALHHLGSTRMRFGDAAGEAELDEASALAREAELPGAVVDIEISRGLGLRALEQDDRAAAVLGEAADAAAEIGGGIAAVANLHAAIALDDTGRHRRAEARYRKALANAEQGTGAYLTAANRLAQLLDGQGRTDDAAAVRTLLE